MDAVIVGAAQRNRRGPCAFKIRDVTRAIKAMTAAGVEGRVEIEPSGKLVIVIGKPTAHATLIAPEAANDNTWMDIDAAQAPAAR